MLRTHIISKVETELEPNHLKEEYDALSIAHTAGERWDFHSENFLLPQLSNYSSACR